MRKYERKPFNGTDEDRAYLLGLTRGDLSPKLYAIESEIDTLRNLVDVQEDDYVLLARRTFEKKHQKLADGSSQEAVQ